MIRRITIEAYLDERNKIPLVDVRTPAEFAQGHIPKAFNIPLFSNEERVKVGTTYVQKNREKAILLGFDLIGSRWRYFIEQALEIAPNKKIAVHCWRGGMRSGAMAWALDFYGFETYVIEGGYKSYRHWSLNTFEKTFSIVILGGMTGSHKTDILIELKNSGEQIIDLEDLAQHQGSAFGSMGKMIQPTQEQFENNLALQLSQTDPTKRLWMEDESQNIGKRLISKSLFLQMQNSPMIELRIPTEQRIDYLTEQYGSLDKDFLIECVQRIKKRLGLDQAQKAIQAIEENRMRDFVKVVLIYYDKGYHKSLSNHKLEENIFPLSLNYENAESAGNKVLEFLNQKIISIYNGNRNH